VQVRLVKGRGGAFEVSAGNDLLFSKQQLGRFPQGGEVESLVAARLGP
jgi:selenoprotein W-related protein